VGVVCLFGFVLAIKSGRIISKLVIADALALRAASAHVAGGSVSLFDDVVAVDAIGRFDFWLELRRDDPVIDARSESFSWRSSWMMRSSSFSLLRLCSSRVRRACWIRSSWIFMA